MKSNKNSSLLGGLAAAILVLGLLAGTCARANGAQIRVTHSDTPYHSSSKTATPAQPAVAQAGKAEVQVAVLAQQTPKPAVRRSIPRK
jgi:hypothetical protein